MSADTVVITNEPVNNFVYFKFKLKLLMEKAKVLRLNKYYIN